MKLSSVDYEFIAVCISAGRKENYTFLRTYLNEARSKKMQRYLEDKPESLYDVMQSLSNDEVIGVIRSFIVAEKFVSTWPRKERNPAFILYKQLIRRAPEVRDDLDGWIRIHTNCNAYLRYKLGKSRSTYFVNKRFNRIKCCCFLLVVCGIVYLLLLPLMAKEISFLNSLSTIIIFTVYALIAFGLFVALYSFLVDKSSESKKTQSDDIFEMIEARKDRARNIGVPDLFGFLFHKHLKFYPKWLAQNQKQKICPLVSDIVKDSDNDLSFTLNGHRYKISFIEQQMFSSADDVAVLRADFELHTEDDKILSLKMTKEGYGYDSEWQVVDITAFKEADWLQDFLDLRERIVSSHDKDSQKTEEEKVHQMKSDFGL